VVHALVEFADGSTIAQLSMPDMRLPIGLALGWPDRSGVPVGRLDWTRAQRLEFAPVDRATFPLLDLAVAAGRAGGTAPAVLNAANEEAVGAFLSRRLPFGGIAEVVTRVLDAHAQPAELDLGAVLAAEQWSRDLARTLVEDVPVTRRPNE
jgi:1-deoxy-D-xylulose-5-phosphate reductoisomerase